jgi:CRP/FNR family transcriptional regulator, cyclic AMP receptor protein
MRDDRKIIAGSELFGGVDDSALERLTAVGRLVSAPSGTMLFKLGDNAEALYVVLQGRVALRLPMQIRSVQQEITVDEKGPGDLVGWSALVPPNRSTLGARAVIDSELMLFPASALAAALREDPAAGLQVMSNLATVVGRRMHLVQAMWVRELERLVTARYA